jgi:hypothetical protein
MSSTAAMVLAKAAAFDPTFPKPDAMILAAWSEALAGINPQSALNAVTAHYRASSVRIMPADVLRIVRAQPRPVTDAHMVPDADPDDVPAYLAALRSGRLVDANRDVVPQPERVRALVAQALEARRLA